MKHSFVLLACLALGCSLPVDQGGSDATAGPFPPPTGPENPAPTPTEPASNPGPNADWLVQEWSWGSGTTLSLDADGTGHSFTMSTSTWETTGNQFAWTSDGATFFTRDGHAEDFGLSSNCRALELNGFTYSGERKASCPNPPIPLNVLEFSLVGSWLFMTGSSIFTETTGARFVLEDDRYAELYEDPLSSYPTLTGEWKIEGSQLIFTSPRATLVKTITFSGKPAAWADATMVIHGALTAGYVQPGY